MRRLASKTVFLGFIAAWFLAASPMRRSSDENATYEGVVRLPSVKTRIGERCLKKKSTFQPLTIIGNDLNTIVLPNTNTTTGKVKNQTNQLVGREQQMHSRVSGAKIDADGALVEILCGHFLW
jgi:hypothetical protein